MGAGPKPLRTAVLVVHGMGIQRPMGTVRGVFDAIWLTDDQLPEDEKKYWTHPEPSGDDIDLRALTTFKTQKYRRVFDFHEFYWSYLMSGTPFVAVLLWLFELVRKGPNLKDNMRALWWGGAIYLGFVTLSVSHLLLLIARQISSIGNQTFSVFVEVLWLTVIISGLGCLFALVGRSFRLAGWLASFALPLGAIGYGVSLTQWNLESLTVLSLPPVLAMAGALLLMGRWGLVAVVLAYALSFGLYWIITVGISHGTFAENIHKDYLPFSLNEHWSSVGAFLIIGTYVVLDALFLRPFLGDAARYFPNSPGNVAVRRKIRSEAISILEKLHGCGDYDRIIVVAHSLGTVIAYDMLRAYFAKICDQLQAPAEGADPDFDRLDKCGALSDVEIRNAGRGIIRKFAPTAQAAASDAKGGRRSWLVTDFVTLGSPLTHVHYLMCRGDSEQKLRQDFEDRVKQREFPVCPPKLLDGNGRLTFVNPNNGTRYFHHGAVFALTRWTNLYFPVSELLWGDAIGGGVQRDLAGGDLFGDGVRDIAVSTRRDGAASFFTHTAYWDPKRDAEGVEPHIVELRRAINLADEDELASERAA